MAFNSIASTRRLGAKLAAQDAAYEQHALGKQAARFDLREEWVVLGSGTVQALVAAARSQAGGTDAYWQGYAAELVAAGFPQAPSL